MRQVLLAIALAVPLAITAIGLGAIALSERVGATLLDGRAPANLAEAGASARADLVIRFLRAGEDPARVYPVHQDVISSAVLEATALEAAIWSRQLEIVELLDREGAIPHDGGTRRSLACLALDLGVDDVAEYLAAADAAPCMPEQALQAVMARTRSAERR